MSDYEPLDEAELQILGDLDRRTGFLGEQAAAEIRALRALVTVQEVELRSQHERFLELARKAEVWKAGADKLEAVVSFLEAK